MTIDDVYMALTKFSRTTYELIWFVNINQIESVTQCKLIGQSGLFDAVMLWDGGVDFTAEEKQFATECVAAVRSAGLKAIICRRYVSRLEQLFDLDYYYQWRAELMSVEADAYGIDIEGYKKEIDQLMADRLPVHVRNAYLAFARSVQGLDYAVPCGNFTTQDQGIYWCLSQIAPNQIAPKYYDNGAEVDWKHTHEQIWVSFTKEHEGNKLYHPKAVHTLRKNTLVYAKGDESNRVAEYYAK